MATSMTLSAFQAPPNGSELMPTADELRRFALSLGVLPSTDHTLTAAHCDCVFRSIMTRLVELIGEEQSLGSIRRTIERFVENEGLRHIFIETSSLCRLGTNGNSMEMVLTISIRAAGCSCLQRRFRQKN